MMQFLRGPSKDPDPNLGNIVGNNFSDFPQNTIQPSWANRFSETSDVHKAAEHKQFTCQSKQSEQVSRNFCNKTAAQKGQLANISTVREIFEMQCVKLTVTL